MAAIAIWWPKRTGHLNRQVVAMKRVVIFTKGNLRRHEVIRLKDELDARGFTVEICRPHLFAIVMGADPVITYQGKLFPLPDLLLARTGSGTRSHAATILSQMEAMGCLVVNSLASIQGAMNKIVTLQKASFANLPIPRTMIRLASEDLAVGWKESGGSYPAVAKIPVGSQGKGVFICRSASQLTAIARLVNVLDPQISIIVQEFVGEAGIDIRCFVVGGKAIGAMKRTGEEIANISAGGQGEPFELSPKIIEISEKISQILGLEIAGIDLLISGDEYVLCEANSSPGFKGFDKYCQSNMAGKIADYIVERLESLAGIES